jgi:hypothetical protein
LKWNRSTGAASYEYCINTTNLNACGLSSWVSTGTNTSVTLSGLKPATRYYWQARARNASGVTFADGKSTAWWHFDTRPLPGAFARATPANGAKNQQTNPGLLLRWNPSTGADSYEYCLATSSSACGPATAWKSTTHTQVSLGQLTPSTTYYWQVRAKNTAGYTYAKGGSGSWWRFTTLPALPGAFKLTGPGNGSLSALTRVTLTWGSSSNAAGYEYCVDITQNMACKSGWVSAGTHQSKAVSGLTPGVTYYWLVRATNAAGTTYSGGGIWWSFTIKP